MSSIQASTHNLEETFKLAARVGAQIQAGQVIALSGDLGAGKTAFVKGLAKFFGIKSVVTSPTFLLLKNYPVIKHPKIKNFVHIDMYRLETANDLREIGLYDFLGHKDSLVLIEWAEKFPQILPPAPQTIWIKIKNSPTEDDGRLFEIHGLSKI